MSSIPLMELSLVHLAHRYVIITPIRDEEAFIEKTLQSVIAQTILPVEWVIVDDGSTDRTGEIVDKYVEQYAWIHAVHRKNRGFRSSGGGVIEAFYAGYSALRKTDWNFIVKLDGDLSFDADYFEKIFENFGQYQDLGVAGGEIYNIVNGVQMLEQCPRFHVRGATKIYKRECWNAIGGLLVAPGWDTLDEVKANMLGWTTRTIQDLKLTHHKFTGSADGTWGGWVKNGRANYIAGYHPLFMTVKCLKRAFQRPYIISALALYYGFITGYLGGVQQVPDPALIRYLRKQQLNRLFMRDTIWE